MQSYHQRILYPLLAVLVLLICACSSPSANAGTVASPIATPTFAPTSLPTATSAPVSQHFKQTEAVQVQGQWDAEIVSVKTSKGSEFSKPQQAGDVFLVFVVKVKNISASEQNISSFLNFTLLDSGGQKYDQTFFTDAGATLNGKVEPNGGLLQGSLAYEVPASMRAFTLAFVPNFLASGQVIWDVKV